MARFLTVRRRPTAKWVVLAVCLLVMFVSVGGEPAGQVQRRREQRVDELPAQRRRVDEVLGITEELQGGEQAPIVIVYRREGGLTRADQARIAADRDRAQRGDRGEQGRHLPRGVAVRRAAAVGVRRRGAADRQHHRRRRRRHDPRPDRRHPRPGERSRAAGSRSRSPARPGFAADAIKVFENINGTLLGAALLIVVRAADPDLPQPDLPLDPAVRGRLRRGHDALDRLRPDRARA